MVESNHQCQEAFHNSTLLSQTFMHNENLNQLVKSANFNKSYASFIVPKRGVKRGVRTCHRSNYQNASIDLKVDMDVL